MRVDDFPPEHRERVAAILAAPKAPTFRQWATKVAPWFIWHRHNVAIADLLQRVFDHELLRVVINMPPRHGKTELVSKLFPAYWLSRRPHEWVGLASYSASLAFDLSL